MNIKYGLGFAFFLGLVLAALLFMSKKFSAKFNAQTITTMWLIGIVVLVLFGIIVITIFINHLRRGDAKTARKLGKG